jgi:hypothetical protein
MYTYDPHLLSVMLADRRADLQRAAARSRNAPMSNRRRRLRRVVVAVLRRLRPAPRLSWQRELDELLNSLLPLEATATAGLDPDSDRLVVETPLESDRHALDLVSAPR